MRPYAFEHRIQAVRSTLANGFHSLVELSLPVSGQLRSPSVEVRLKVNHQAVLTVRDFGRGVPAELLQGSQTSGQHVGVGLSGMRERVNDLGGTFEIQSSGNGTLIAVSIPLVETSAARNNSGRNRIA